MTRIAVFVLALMLATSVAHAQNSPNSIPNSVWGSSGQYRGFTDRNGNLYGPDNRYVGTIERRGARGARASEAAPGRQRAQQHLDRDRSIYGPGGQYLGTMDRSGDFWDQNGRYRGRLR